MRGSLAPSTTLLVALLAVVAGAMTFAVLGGGETAENQFLRYITDNAPAAAIEEDELTREEALEFAHGLCPMTQLEARDQRQFALSLLNGAETPKERAVGKYAVALIHNEVHLPGEEALSKSPEGGPHRWPPLAPRCSARR